MSGENLELLCFQVGGRVFALDIMVIREILRQQVVTPLPGAPAHIAGVINLRGELIPAIDLDRGLLGGPGHEGMVDPKLVVVKTASRKAGVLMDQVLEVVSVPLQDLRPLPGNEAMEEVAVAAFRRELEGLGPTVVLLVRLAPLLAVDEEAPTGAVG